MPTKISFITPEFCAQGLMFPFKVLSIFLFLCVECYAMRNAEWGTSTDINFRMLDMICLLLNIIKYYLIAIYKINIYEEEEKFMQTAIILQISCSVSPADFFMQTT